MKSREKTNRDKKSMNKDAMLRTTAARRIPAAAPMAPLPKVLRIGVIQGGKIVEERIIREREDVTVGQSERSLFVLPSPRLPGRFVIFELKKGGYVLNVGDFMGGKVSVAGSTTYLGVDQKKKHVPLDEKSRGKITIGDSTLLFQFVAPPPLQPKPQLPSSMRSGWFKSFAGDWFFNSIVLASLIGQLLPVLYLVQKDWPLQDEFSIDVDDRYLKLVLQAPEEDILKKMLGENEADVNGEAAEEESEAAGEEEVKKAGIKDKKIVKKVLTPEEKEALEAQRRARMEAQVSEKGILAVLGSSGKGADGKAGTDLLAVGGVAGDYDELMKNVKGVRNSGVGDTGSSLRSMAGAAGGTKVADIDGIKVSDADVDIDSKDAIERKIKPRTKIGPGGETDKSTGLLDEGQVKKVLLSRITAIQMCYQKGLNKNFKLEGKVVVRFTISTTGRVTKATVVSETLGDPNVVECVVGKVRSLVFPKPAGGSVEYVFPFVFKAGG